MWRWHVSTTSCLFCWPNKGFYEGITRWGRRRQEKERKEERKREKKEREGEGKKNLCLPRRTTKNQDSQRFSRWFLLKIMLQTSRFMCWNVKYVDSLIYFMKKVWAFVVLKLVFISVLNTIFLPEFFWLCLGVVDLQIRNMIVFWKSLDF